MSVCSPSEIPDQPRCKFCGNPIPLGDRRPREYCSDAHRVAASRVRRHGSELPNGHPTSSDAYTAEFRISEQRTPLNSLDFFRAQNRPFPPLNLLGGQRWNGDVTAVRRAKIKAAIDGEIGVAGFGELTTSPHGVRCFVIPSRRAR
jgi:hypothetical protein